MALARCYYVPGSFTFPMKNADKIDLYRCNEVVRVLREIEGTTNIEISMDSDGKRSVQADFVSFDVAEQAMRKIEELSFPDLTWQPINR